LSQNGPLIAFLATLVVVVISIIPIISGLESFSSVPTAQQSYAKEGDIFYTGLYLTALLFAIAVIATILLSIFQVINNPKASSKSLIALGILAVVFIILFMVTDAKGTGSLAQTIERFSVTDSISKIIGAGLQLTVIMFIGSLILAVVLEIWNYFKN
jgi:uncharacterized membrane protein